MTLREQYLNLEGNARQGVFAAEWLDESGLHTEALAISDFNRALVQYYEDEQQTDANVINGHQGTART